MPTLRGKISIAFAALTFALPPVYAKQAGDSESGGRKLGREWAESSKKDSLDGILIGFGFGSLMASGSAQQAVNQEGRREEAAKQEKARKKTAAEESDIKTSGESGKGTTASGTGESRSQPGKQPRTGKDVDLPEASARGSIRAGMYTFR